MTKLMMTRVIYFMLILIPAQCVTLCRVYLVHSLQLYEVVILTNPPFADEEGFVQGHWAL